MTPRSLRSLLAGILLMLAAGALQAGGWVVITTEDLPDHVVAGKPVTLTYAVRQHGRNLVGGLSGRIEARAGSQVVAGRAAAASETGYYSATLALPSAGNWTIAIDSGFGGNFSISRMTLAAIAADRPAPALSEWERGQRLFAAKGCLMCHAHQGLDGPSVKVGPILSAKRYQPDFLKQVLAHPPQARPNDSQMPDLGLRDTEIASLVAFLNGKRSQNNRPTATSRQ